MMKDEAGGKINQEFVGLGPKQYSFKMWEDSSEHKRCKGVKKNVVKKHHSRRLYQELSYRKQITRQLRTQFVEGISVTLKSTLRVTQGHWKRKHWTDHTRLTVRRVIGR